MKYLFISDGRLFLNEGQENMEITSKFAEEKTEEAQRERSVHGWKSDRRQDVDPYYGSNIIWGGQAGRRPFRKFRFKNVMAKNEDSIFYLLTNDIVAGLFEYNISENEELRIFHKNEFHENGMDYSHGLGKFVAAMLNEDQSVNLELLDNQAKYEKSLTSGDSRDSNPCFSKFNNDEILYQSAGIGRDDQGFVWAHGPEAINKINITSCEITTLLADDTYDFLTPKDDQQGNIYCIRRPYHRLGYSSPIKMVWYFITFPVRFIVAILRFLDAFTRLFNREPMTPAGPSLQSRTENKYVSVLGRTIDLAKVERKARFLNEPSLVPNSWELIKLDNQGNISLISKRVSSFDIDDSGKLHITNGFRVKKIIQNKMQTVLKHNIIESIKVVKSM